MSPDDHVILDELERSLDSEAARPEPWRPEPGDVLRGRILEVVDLPANRGGRYPALVIETPSGAVTTWHGMTTMATNALLRLRPEVGDLVVVRYRGQHGERGYHMHDVRASPPRVDWSRFDGRRSR